MEWGRGIEHRLLLVNIQGPEPLGLPTVHLGALVVLPVEGTELVLVGQIFDLVEDDEEEGRFAKPHQVLHLEVSLGLLCGGSRDRESNSGLGVMSPSNYHFSIPQYESR